MSASAIMLVGIEDLPHQLLVTHYYVQNEKFLQKDSKSYLTIVDKIKASPLKLCLL